MSGVIRCPICLEQADEKIRKSIDGITVTSDANFSTSLDPHLCYCAGCYYWFTFQRLGLDEYYVSEYNLLMQDFNTDQLIMRGGRPYKRAEYQALLVKTVAESLPGQCLVEVGAGKGLTAFHVRRYVQPESLSLHDPGSSRYLPIWDNYIQPTSIHSNLEELKSLKFDLAFTFFSLEHALRPVSDMSLLVDSLRDHALLIGVVPWLCANPGDLLVGDHCSHFTNASLNRLLKEAHDNHGIEFRVLVNGPLRALMYLCSHSSERIDKAIDVLLGSMFSADFTDTRGLIEPSDEKIFATAVRHWKVEVDAPGVREEVLWGAGFYSKLIMLRHRLREFSACIDSNSSLVGTKFVDLSGRELKVSASSAWLNDSSGGERLWFGVSASARDAILVEISTALVKKRVDIAF